jgi:hypothetical protein
MGSPSPAQDAARLRVAVAPSGELLVETAGADADKTSDGLTPVARARVTAAFRRGPGHGLLHLGTTELDGSLFVLSVRAGGTGFNLTAAAHVVHFDRWWNPAVENQATDRAYRIGQHRNVLVHKLVCRGTVEERIDRLIEEKQSLARGLFEGGGEALLTEMNNEELMAMVALDPGRATAEA